MRSLAAEAIADCERCAYVDRLYAPGYDEVDFADADHLSARGAARLTRTVDSTFVALSDQGLE